MMINCCRGCVPPKRHAKCHATCEEYMKEKQKHDQIKTQKHKDASASDDIYIARRKIRRRFN